MTISSVHSASAPSPASSGGGFASLDQSDFLKLMTVQMQHQDPFDPVDNKEMLAQMAQFSSLAGTAETNETLGKIVEKLDALIAAQNPGETEPANDA